jgi:membrane-bound lytic murein transglycosylase MltF
VLNIAYRSSMLMAKCHKWMNAMNKTSAPHNCSIKPTPFAYVRFVVFIFALIPSACRQSGVQQAPAQGSGQTPVQGTGQDEGRHLQDLPVRLAPHKGDIEEMDKRRVVRALVSFNKTGFFFDNGRPRGMTYDALLEFEKFLNRKLHPKDRTGKEKVEVVLVPTTAASVDSDLLNGNGDMVAVAVYITESRKKVVDFIPVSSSQHDVVVAGSDAPSLASLEDLSGKEVYLNKESLAWEKLTDLNKKLSAANKPQIKLLPADGNLERDDFIEMASVGLVQYTVTPSHIAQLWKNVFTSLRIYEDFPVTEGMDSGWAVRRDSPKLRGLLEEFASTHREGTAYFTTLANRYLNSAHFIKNNENTESVKRFRQMKGLFQKYSNRYEFPWMLIAAQAYQESQLNQQARSPVGAIGVMQVMPTTAASPPVNIPDVTKLEPNIHAGVKLLKYIRDDYFKDDPMDPLNKTLMTLAAYNAGPERVKQCRHMAGDMGLNPNLWFQNVEYAVAKKVGAETVEYVSNIYKYYLGWKFMTEREAERTKAEQAQLSHAQASTKKVPAKKK